MLLAGAYSVLNGLGPDSLGVSTLLLIGVMNGGLISAAVGALHLFGDRTPVWRAVERAPFLITLLSKCVVYGLVVGVVLFGRIGSRLAGVQSLPAFGPSDVRALVFAIIVIVAFMFLLQISELIGRRTLRDLVLGRYHSPRVEERFFLFIDVRGSTGIAERLGPAAVHRFLRRVFAVASDPVDDDRGEIHQYVGDEMVVTWLVKDGRERARPVRCFFAIERALGDHTAEFASRFGVMPRVRAALHAGAVIAGEVGESKREIVFHGDVMNTTSRLEHMAGESSARLLVSEDALRRLDGLDGYVINDLGMLAVRGRQEEIRVFALEPAGDLLGAGAVPSAPGVAGVRVWEVMSRRRGPRGG
jgi:adenylate cyclase